MKTKALIAAAVFCGLTVWAQDTTTSTTATTQTTTYRTPTDQLFMANELDLDLFGSISVNQDTINNISGKRVADDGRLGAGAGLSYFPIRYLGFGADAYTENTGHNFVDNASGNLILRLPIETVHLAPYVFGGGGRQFDPVYAWFGQAGVGLDIRVTRHWGFFADARYVMPQHIDNFGVGRVGLRIAF
jgi:hypothetical protein